MNKSRLKILTFLTLAVAVVSSFHMQSQPAGGLTPAIVARITSKPIDEVSGMAKSRSYPDLYWVLNDSGDKARLFAINREGKNIIPTYSRFSNYGEEEEEGKKQWQGFKVLYAKNVDWESMTVDDNYLYVADTGNNFNNRKDLGIYALSEIDPTASTQSAAIKFLPVRYPEQTQYPGTGDWHFDSESLFNDGGKLYLVTKHRSRLGRLEPGANLYRLDTDFTDRDNLLTLIDANDGIFSATGAELSPDGNTLAVISYTDLWLFDRPATGDAWLSSSYRRYPLNTEHMRQVETVIWDGEDALLLSNEQRDLFRISLDDLPPAANKTQ